MGRIVANCVPRAQGRCLLFLWPEKSENTQEDKQVNHFQTMAFGPLGKKK